MSDTLRTDVCVSMDDYRTLAAQLERELNSALKELDEANSAIGDMRSAMCAHMAVCGRTLEWAYCEGMNDMENSRGRTQDELWAASETKRMAEGKEKK